MSKNFDDAAKQELLDYEYTVKPSLLGKFKEFFSASLVMALCASGIVMIPEKGIWLHKLLHLNINLLKIKITYSMLSYPLYIIMFLSFLYFIYHYMLVKLYTIQVSTRELVIDRNVFGGKNPTDLNEVVDLDIPQNLMLTLLGIRPFCIKIRGEKERVLVPAMKKSIAEDMGAFIRANSYDNYTQYRTTKDRYKDKKNREQNIKDFDRDEVVDRRTKEIGNTMEEEEFYDHKGRSRDGDYDDQ